MTKNKSATTFLQTSFHGKKADLELDGFIEPGYTTNYGRKIDSKS